MRLILVLALLFAKPAFAIDTDKVAHFGLSYAATTLLYGLTKQLILSPCKERYTAADRCQISEDSRALASFMATTLIFLGGMLKEGMDAQVDSGDILANGVGAGSGMLLINLFEF